ncbi:hypothetical protein [uncultured Sunxiuqinia sp.]|uniref:hypothetical protein n=1 Tax=uncultured Sunxiuqinia sp. TaxID=1573825 RepID=UPI0030DD42FC|tara:strand:- start:14596 stop:15051 length:456 start_codon:yes stop_codon:yes gene_type:complete
MGHLKMKKFKIIIAITVFTTSCVVQNPKYFSSVEQSQNEAYGYTPLEPVEIKNGPLESSINSSYYYFSRLRTTDGESLKIIGRSSFGNPHYKSTGIYNRYTEQPIGGGGMLLDRYVLTPANNPKDTIIIFINPYKKGETKIPKGLKFEKEK